MIPPVTSGTLRVSTPTTAIHGRQAPTNKQIGLDVKTMTCQHLGGPCAFELRGSTADEIIKAQDWHLNDAVEQGDAAHRAALDDMQARWKRPVSGMRWYRNTKRAFTQLPDDQPDRPA